MTPVIASSRSYSDMADECAGDGSRVRPSSHEPEPVARPCAQGAIWCTLLDVKRVLWLLLAAFVLVWGGVLLDTGGADLPATRGPSTAPAAAKDAPRTSVSPAQRAHPSVDEAAAVVTAAPAPGRQPSTGAAQPAPPGRGGVHLVGKQHPASAAATARSAAQLEAEGALPDSLRGEHGEGLLSPEYVELERDYVNEVRDASWALPQEQRLRALLRSSPLREEVALVNCLESVCRIVLETESNDAFDRLVEVEGLRDATGLSAGTPYSLRAGQLSVYFRRPR